MSKVWLLTKILLKTNFVFDLGGSKNGKRKNKFLGWIGVGLIALFVFASLGVPIIYALDSVLEIIPVKNILLSIILPLAGMTTIVFGVFSIVSVFYFSKDIENLLPLPIKSKDILLSKFLVSIINQYYILFMFILPCLIGVGVGIDAGLMYYVYAILNFILLPIIPSAIVSFIILLITIFTGITKNKDVFMYFSISIVLIFSFGYSYIISNVTSSNMENIGVVLGDVENMLLPYLRMIFPFYNSGVSSLINYNNLNGVFSFIAFLGFNIIAVLIIYFLGDKLYLKTLTVTNGSKKKIVNVESIVKNNKNSGSFLWLLKKEWLIVKRTPIFMLNIVVIVFLMPLILVISFVFSFIDGGGNIFLSFNKEILDTPYVYLIILLIAVFFTSTSLAASTSISREGSNAWFMKVIPVSYFKQINVKVFFAVLLDLLGVVFISVVPIVMYKISFVYVMGVLIPLVIIVVLLNYLNILMDLKRPKLKWDEESVAVKQNMNGFISVLLTFAVSSIIGIVAFVIYYCSVNINVILLSLIITLISGLMLSLVIYLFYKNRNRLLDNVD